MLHRAFYDKLRWSHQKYVMFMKTCGKPSEFNFTTTYAYSTEYMVVGVMDKHEFVQCFEEINNTFSLDHNSPPPVFYSIHGYFIELVIRFYISRKMLFLQKTYMEFINGTSLFPLMYHTFSVDIP